MSWMKEKKEHPWVTTAQAKRIASDHARQKRQPYQKRFHQPLFPHIAKTTTVEGKRDYQREYMRRLRNIKRATR